MNESEPRTPDRLIKRVHETENQLEESLREASLANTLFHIDHLIEVYLNPELSEENLKILKEDFLSEKKGLNMGEVFALAHSDKYRGKLHLVELGKSTDPGSCYELDGLKTEYNQFADWANKQSDEDIRIRELTRAESGRYVSFRPPVLDEAAKTTMIFMRNRPLMLGSMSYRGLGMDIGIAKRMVFSVPIKTFLALDSGRTARDTNRFEDVRSLQLIETMLENGSGGVRPIRTAYYLATDERI